MNGHCTFKYCCPCIVEAEVWPATGLIVEAEVWPATGLIVEAEVWPATGLIVEAEVWPATGLIVEAEVWPATGLILRENSLKHFSGLVLVNAISENVLTGSDQFWSVRCQRKPVLT